jgi:hypothetical protein
MDVHLVMCGFPRSGTTLLQLMLETAYPDACRFGRERSALFLARHIWPGSYPLMISKRPNDIFWVDEIRRGYEHRATRARFVVSTRDPRAVLTSFHSGRPGYYVTVERWRAVFAHVQYVRRFPDVIVVEYRDLVERPLDVQCAVSSVIGRAPAAPFDSFHASVPPEFDTRPLNGVRPLDEHSVDKWRHPRHKERIRELLTTMPELPDRLMELGYEQDALWTRDYA